MPVLSFSVSSSPAIHCLAPDMDSLSLSRSFEYPGFIIPPSVMPIGGSSHMERSIIVYRTSKSAIEESIDLSIGALSPESSYFISGSWPTVFFRAIRSLASALPVATLAVSLWKSYTCLRLFVILFATTGSRLSSSTASSLRLISVTSVSGSLSQDLRSLPPMAVLVFPITPRSDPLISPSYMVSSSSRLRSVDLSRCITPSCCFIVMFLN